MEEEKRNTREFEQFYEKMREEHQIYQVEDFITDLIDCLSLIHISTNIIGQYGYFRCCCHTIIRKGDYISRRI